ncbi:MAG: carboxypeptidase regulatory-like domain-containing protein [Rubripirellula sp.]
MKRLLATLSLFAMGLITAPALVAQTTVVNHLTMNQWVSPTADGALTGRVILPQSDGQAKALEDISIAIMSRDGEVLRAKTNSRGEFSISDVESGVYALTARGENVFACCAMHVIEDVAGFPKSAEVSVANIDYTVVNTAIIRYLPPNVKSSNASISNVKLEGLVNQVCGDELFRVAQVKGGMKGRLHVAGAVGADLRGANLTNVFVFKDGMQIDRTVTNENGQFDIEKIQPGYYSLLAVGHSGVGLIGFELVDESELTETVSNDSADQSERLVGLRHRRKGGCCCQEFAMQIAPMPEIVSCVEEVIIEQPACGGCGSCDTCGGIVDGGVGMDGGVIMDGGMVDGGIVTDGFGNPVAGGGFVPGGGFGGGSGGFSGGGGGLSGGGGGGGFGGGLGGLAALGAVGGVIAATSDDNNNNAIVAPVTASAAAP